MIDYAHTIDLFERITMNSDEKIFIEYRQEEAMIVVGRNDTWAGGRSIYEAIDNFIVSAAADYGTKNG